MWLYYSNTRSSFLDIFVLIHDSETNPLKNLIKLIFSQLLRARTHTILKCPIFTYWVWLADAYIAIFNCGAKVWASLRKWSSPLSGYEWPLLFNPSSWCSDFNSGGSTEAWACWFLCQEPNLITLQDQENEVNEINTIWYHLKCLFFFFNRNFV